MKTLILAILFSLALCGVALAQTNLVLTNAVVTIPALPIADRFTQLLDRIVAGLATLSTLAAVLLGWWGSNRAKLASLVAPMIKEIEKHGDQNLKDNIKDAAGELGIEPSLNAAVKANTTNIPTPDGPVKIV